MHSPCSPPKFDQQDWSQFDFSRWHLDGVALDAASAAFANLSEQFFNSDEWQQHFQATLPALEQAAISFFKDHSQQLRDQRNAVAEDFDKRITAAQERSDAFRRTVESASAPPVIEASPNKFHLAVRVTSEDARFGLPGVAVQIIDPRNEKHILGHAITDRDGSAILTIAEEIAKELGKGDAALEVLSPAGQTLVKLPGAVCVRLNQVETKVVSIKDSEDIGPQKTAALQIRAEREAHMGNLAARIDSLKRECEARLHDLDCRSEDNEAIIAELEAKGDTSQSAAAAPPQDMPPQTDASKGESPPVSKRSRKKR